MKTSNIILLSTLVIILIIITAVMFYARFNVFTEIVGKNLKGDGSLYEGKRNVESFKEIDIRGNISVYLLQDHTEEVRVKTNANLNNYLITETLGEVLKIYTSEKVSSGLLEVYVSFNELGKIKVSENAKLNSVHPFELSELIIKANTAGEVDITGNFNELNAELNTASKLTISGISKILNLSASTASNFKGKNFIVSSCHIDASTASKVEVFVNDTLDVKINTAGTVSYDGSPVITRQNVSSGGKLISTDGKTSIN